MQKHPLLTIEDAFASYQRIPDRLLLPMDIKNKLSKFTKPASWIALLILAGLFFVLISSCQGDTQTLSSFSIATATPTATTGTTAESTVSPEDQPTEEQVISTPTLAPTATPGPLDFLVEDIGEDTGLDRINFLGLNGENLISLLISILIVIAGSLVGWFLINMALRLAKFTPPSLDDKLLEITQKQFKWLVTILLIQFATARLIFLSAELKQRLNLIYFSLIVILIATIIMKLIEYGLEGPLTRAATPEQRDILITFFPLFYRLAQVGIVIVSMAIILRSIGFNLSALLAILGLGGLAVSLAAKETLADMISGFIILIEHPYQIGDRIKIETMDTWGDVETIGMRTTRIRTLDNRLVIVPNSVISRNQVENYTIPDPSVRVEISVGIGFDSDLDLVQATIRRAITSTPGISQENPIVDLVEFGDSALIFRVMYWLKTYNDIRLQSEVNKAIYRALTDAEIEMPFITYDVNLHYPDNPQETGKPDRSNDKN